MHTDTKVTTVLLLNLKASTLVNVNNLHGFEYPISGDAVSTLTGPAQTTVDIWSLVAA